MPTPHIYLAPMEGVTIPIPRAHAAVYGPLDKYFTPFLEPREKRSMKTKERNEVLPEHNEGLNVVPQILTNRSRLPGAGRDSMGNGLSGDQPESGCPLQNRRDPGQGLRLPGCPGELDRFFF